ASLYDTAPPHQPCIASRWQTMPCYFILQKVFLCPARAPPGFTQRNSTMQRRVGRPKGEASTGVNSRLPRSLVQRLDRYLDKLETETGLHTNRGMILRHALQVFLEAKGMECLTAQCRQVRLWHSPGG